MNLLANFFTGVFLCNCLPHLVAGLQGKAFPTPFAKPRGVGLSSPLLNFLWGVANLLTGLVLLTVAPLSLSIGLGSGLALLGALLLGAYLARHFGAVLG